MTSRQMTDVKISGGGSGSGLDMMRSSYNRQSITSQKSDPYQIDFQNLRKTYAKETVCKLPFIKSSFLHYSKCPQPLIFNGVKMSDELVLTMELVQAPKHLNYTQLTDPKLAKKLEMARRKEEAARKKKQERMSIRQTNKENKKKERQQEKQERTKVRGERKAEQEQAYQEYVEQYEEKQKVFEQKQQENMQKRLQKRQNQINEDDNISDEEEEEGQSIEEMQTFSEFIASEGSDVEAEEYPDEDDYNESYPESEEDDEDLNYQDDEDESESEESDYEEQSETSGEEGEDREYTGDMFAKVKPVKFVADKAKAIGNHNTKLNVNEYVCFSIWKNSAIDLRYSRLKDTIIPIPPVQSDQRFYTSHSCKSVYYLGEVVIFTNKNGQEDVNGKNKKIKTVLVVVALKDLKYKTYDLDKVGEILTDLKNSSLIKNDTVLCYQRKEINKVYDRQKLAYKSKDRNNFYLLDLEKNQHIWEIKQAVRVFFSSDNAEDIDPVNFGEEDNEQSFDGLSQKSENTTPQKIYIVKYSKETVEVQPDQEDKDGDGKPDQPKGMQGIGGALMGQMAAVSGKRKSILMDKLKDKEEPKMEIRKYMRTYQVEFQEEIDYKKEDSKKFEAYIVQHDQKKLKKELEKKRITNVTEGIPEQIALGTLGIGIGSQIKEKSQVAVEDKQNVKKVKQIVDFASDCDLKTLTILVHGQRGEQHQIFQFTEDKIQPYSSTQRAGNTHLEFNQDWHLRTKEDLFLISTESSGSCSAKLLEFGEEKEEIHNEKKGNRKKIPIVTLINASKQLLKDVWFIDASADTKEGECETCISTLCKSSTDDFLQCEVLDLSKYDYKRQETLKNLKQKGSKIRSQEIEMTYPVLVSNIGLRKIQVQSMASPDLVATFNLFDQDFVCFAQYQTFNDVGLLDKRTQTEKENVPFEESSQKIAFLSRRANKEILLNILCVDSFASPMKFELLTTEYEAGMDGGIRDDCIYKAFVMQVNSVRGLDVSLVAQYNDAIIFDCITSTRQLPIRFPMPMKNDEQNKEMYFNEKEKKIDWEWTLDICKGANVIKQTMIMDSRGAVYFCVKMESGIVKVLRVDPTAEMGNTGFIKSIFSIRCQYIHFLTIREDKFLLMDDKKKIRVLTQSPETFMLTQDSTIELSAKDQYDIKYSDFDEFVLSSELMHWDNRIMYLHETKAKDGFTFAQSNIMYENHKFIAGPKTAKSSGMVYYLQKYDFVDDDEDGTGEESQITSMFNRQAQSSAFKGFSIIMHPLADLSYLDILPQLTKNNNNFSTYIDSNHIMLRFSGRFLIFHSSGEYKGQVQFQDMEPAFRQEQLKIICISDNMKFIVFEGPTFIERTKKKNKKDEAKASQVNPLNKSTGLLGGLLDLKKDKENEEEEKLKKDKAMRERNFYVFKLEWKTDLFTKKTTWKFVEYEMKLLPILNPEERMRTSQAIDYKGCFSQSSIVNCDSIGDEAQIKIKVKSYQSQLLDKTGASRKEEKQAGSPLNFFKKVNDTGPAQEETYTLIFGAEQRAAKEAVLTRKIKSLQRKIDNKVADSRAEWRLTKLLDRRAYMDRIYLFQNYIVVKSGSEVQYIERDLSGFEKLTQNPLVLNCSFGSEIWINSVYSTGVDDLVQFFLINDEMKRYFVLTWNLRLNREHSNFQSTYSPNTNPEYLFLRCFGGNKTENFNIILDQGAMITLQNNLPIQFFDIENERDWEPHYELQNFLPGQCKVQQDKKKYLELVYPGRLQHFISYSDLTYWYRYEINKEMHELSKGKVTSIAPIARFPEGISIFHVFATNVKVLEAVQNSVQSALQAMPDDPRLTMLPLMFLHSNPDLNKPGQKTTPLHIALDKQSPLSFEIMLGMLKDKKKVSVTSQLLDRLEDIVNQNSQVVNEFFNECFFITDQFDGPRALNWTIGEDKEEHYVNVPTSFLTQEYLQSLVEGNDKIIEEEPEEENNSDAFAAFMGGNINEEDGPAKYDIECEDLTVDKEDTSDLRQVEAKLLEFNWIFTGTNAAKFITILSDTDNDDIFATSQIRVLIDFLWSFYYKAIFWQLFVPFVIYALTFSYYVTYFSIDKPNELSWRFVFQIACLVIAGKFYITFVLLEAIQISRDKLKYFTDFWNLLDLCSLSINITYVYLELYNKISWDDVNSLGAVAIFIMWIKMFYWMRLFKPFSAFIRMVEQILHSISVFTVMLIMVLAAFANIMIILQLNRHSGKEPVFDPFVDHNIFDAFVHAYLTGLGDFNKDTYSEANAISVWIFFIFATIMVQLVFMNLLIAMMADAYSEITAIEQQSVMKEICNMMEDHIWLLDISNIFKHSRYILWLTPDKATQSGSVIERQIQTLRDYVEDKSETDNQKILRQISQLSEEIDSIKTQLNDLEQKDESDDEDEF